MTGRPGLPEHVAAQSPAGDHRRRPLPQRLGLLAALLSAAWLVPLALNLLRLDIVELGILLLAVASILRSGTILLDRLMLAGSLLAGGLLALGLLTSVWPWGLAPVPVGGTLGSVVVLAGWLVGRRPRLPRRVLGSDVTILGSGVLAFWAVYSPIAHLSAARRLIFSTPTTDRFVHFVRFDTILRLGGYPFLQPRQAQTSINGLTLVYYPTGSHFLYAVFDTFRRSGTGAGPALHEYSRYFVYVLAAYAFLVMAIVWAARWIAGPRVSGWRSVAISAVAGGLVIGGAFVHVLRLGLDSQPLGLAFFAIAVAVNARPPHVIREQVLVSAALLVAVAYCYNPYLPMVGLGLVLASAVYFSRLRRHWRFSAAVVAVGCVIAFYPSVVAAASGFPVKTQLLDIHGWFVVPPARVYAWVAVVAVSAAAACSIWQRGVPRAMAGQLLAAALVMAGFAAYQLYEVGQVRYYYRKLELAGYVTCLVGLGLLGVILQRIRLPSSPVLVIGRLSRGLKEAPVAVITGVAAMLVMVGAQPRSPTPGSPPIWGGTPIQIWNAGQDKAWAYPSFAALANNRMLGDGTPTLVVSGRAMYDWYDSFLAAALNHDMGEMLPAMREYTSPSVYRRSTNPHTIRLEVATVQHALAKMPVPVRLVAASPALAEKLRVMLAHNPRLKITRIVVLPSLG